MNKQPAGMDDDSKPGQPPAGYTLNIIIFVCRLLQVAIGLATMALSISISVDSYQPYALISAFCGAMVTVWASLEVMLAFVSSREHHWRYTLIHDVLILVATICAGGVLTASYLTSWTNNPVTFIPAITLCTCGILCAVPSIINTVHRSKREAVARSFYQSHSQSYSQPQWFAEQKMLGDDLKAWQASSQAPSIRSHAQSSVHEIPRPRSSPQFAVGSVVSSRPISLAETSAQWSGVGSGPMTLSHRSIRSFETSGVPPYASSLTSNCRQCQGGGMLYQMQSLNGHPAFLPLGCNHVREVQEA